MLLYCVAFHFTKDKFHFQMVLLLLAARAMVIAIRRLGPRRPADNVMVLT